MSFVIKGMKKLKYETNKKTMNLNTSQNHKKLCEKKNKEGKDGQKKRIKKLYIIKKN